MLAVVGQYLVRIVVALFSSGSVHSTVHNLCFLASYFHHFLLVSSFTGVRRLTSSSRQLTKQHKQSSFTEIRKIDFLFAFLSITMLTGCVSSVSKSNIDFCVFEQRIYLSSSANDTWGFRKLVEQTVNDF